MNASGSPIVAGRGKGRGNELHRPGDHPDSQPGGGFQTEGKPRGNPGHFPGNPFAKGGSPGPHTVVTMTIQPQPPVAMAAADPIRLVSFLFLPGLHPIPFNSLQACRRWGPQKRGGGP